MVNKIIFLNRKYSDKIKNGKNKVKHVKQISTIISSLIKS